MSLLKGKVWEEWRKEGRKYRNKFNLSVHRRRK